MQQQQQPQGDRRENKVAVHPQRRRSSSLASSKSSSLGGRAEQQDRSSERRPSKFAVLRRQTSSALQGVKRPFTDLLHLSSHHREGATSAKEQSTLAQDGRVVVARDEGSLSPDRTLLKDPHPAVEAKPSSTIAAEVSIFEESLEAASPNGKNAKVPIDVELLLEENVKFLQLADTNLSVLGRYLSSQTELTEAVEPWCIDSLLSMVSSALLGDQQTDS